MGKHDRNEKLIFYGDFNAKSYMWGSLKTDVRGDILKEWIIENNLLILNEGNKPTFVREDTSSIIDLTFAINNMAEDVQSWVVGEEETLSDHMYIRIELTWGRNNQTTPIRRHVVSYRVEDNKMEEFGEVLKLKVEEARMGEDRLTAQSHVETIREACDRVFRKRVGEAGIIGNPCIGGIGT